MAPSKTEHTFYTFLDILPNVSLNVFEMLHTYSLFLQ